MYHVQNASSANNQVDLCANLQGVDFHARGETIILAMARKRRPEDEVIEPDVKLRDRAIGEITQKNRDGTVPSCGIRGPFDEIPLR